MSSICRPATAWQLNPDWSMQLGYVHYAYLNDNDSGYDYDEVSASVSYQQRATASVSWSPNTSKHVLGIRLGPAGVRIRASVLQPLHPRWSTTQRRLLRSAAISLTPVTGTGAPGRLTAGMQVDLLHIDTDSTATRLFESGSRWTAALTALLEPTPLRGTQSQRPRLQMNSVPSSGHSLSTSGGSSSNARELELLRQVAAGDRTAFKELYLIYHRRLAVSSCE